MRYAYVFDLAYMGLSVSGGISRNFSQAHVRVTQGSVQIELIFRLLLKITVDWP